MEQKDIVFDKGIHREPSVSLSDAELSECVNLMPSHGELVNMKPAEELGASLRSGERLFAIHEVNGVKHYITSYNDALCYSTFADNSLVSKTINITSANLKQVVTVGNVLALIYEQSTVVPMKYLLWKDNAYLVLDSKPEVKLNFRLKGEQKGMSFPNTFKVAPITSALSSGGNFPESVANIHLTDVNISKDTRDDVDYYGYTIKLTNDYLYSKGLRATRNYQLINKTGWEVGIIVRNTNTGESRFEDINVNNPMTFEFTEYTELTISQYTWIETPPTGGFGYIIINGQIAEAAGSDIQYALTKSSDNSEGEKSFTAMMGDVKDFIRYYSYENNKFIFPFFIRYGLKYFDGSVSNLSEPILMLPNTGIIPQLLIDKYDGLATATAVSFVADLEMKVKELPQYSNWKDIITGVVIGITSPIYYINEGEEYSPTKIQGSVIVNNWQQNIKDYGYFVDDYGESSKSLSQYISQYSNAKAVLFPPSLSKSEYVNNIEKASVFYKIKELTWDDLESATGWGKLNNGDFSIKNINTYPVINDSYNDNYSFFPGGGFVYNNRLNIYDMKEMLAKPNIPASPIITHFDSSGESRYRYIFYISENNKSLIVKSEENCDQPDPYWIYYGNPNVTKCRIYKKTGSSYSYCEFNMKRHPWLNGSFCYTNLDFVWKNGNSNDYNPDESNIVSKNNTIYASNASNPFHFSVDNQNLIGTGKINAVSTAAKALSEGQFGQFPLYAFTDDGIWSLSVDEQGKYSTSNPVNRDVVTNTQSICQIDDAVIYACSQGLKQLSGSEAKLLTDAIAGRNVDESQFLDNLDDNHSGLVVSDTNSIINMIEDCIVMYDPSGKRLLHVYPKTSNGKHYVYDLSSGEWSTEVGDSSNVKTIVPGYPFSTFVATVKDAAGANVDKIFQYTNNENNNVTRYGLLLTREYASGDPFAMKMLTDLRLIYSSNNSAHPSKCKVGVFVSNDRKQWRQLKSLRQHSYKWYRFRIQTAMTDLDALTSLSLQMDEKRTNKLR